MTMKRSHKTAAGIVAALSLGVAAAAFAQPGAGDGNGPHGRPGMQHGMMGGMQHGAMGHGAGMGHGTGTEANHAERQKLAQARRSEMQKRAKEAGSALPQQADPQHTH
jgi:hypothetical protein